MLKNANKLKTSWMSASFIVLLAASLTCVNAQENNSPEGRVKSFYSWYLTSLNKQQGPTQNPTKNKTVMRSHLSTRLGGWLYSKTGQNWEADIFVQGQGFNEAWANNVNVGKATIKGNTAVVKLDLGSPPDDWIKRLNISLVKEVGIWKIDRIKGQ